MLLHPTSAKSVFTGISDGADYQPNAVDVRVAKILEYTTQHVHLTEKVKSHRQTRELQPSPDGLYYLYPNAAFEVVFEASVKIAEGEAGWVIPRSTLNRNGVDITSGLYDSGYDGVIGATIHTGGASLSLEPGTRIAQFVLVASESKGLYNGDYGHGKGHDQQKY